MARTGRPRDNRRGCASALGSSCADRTALRQQHAGPWSAGQRVCGLVDSFNLKRRLSWVRAHRDSFPLLRLALFPFGGSHERGPDGSPALRAGQRGERDGSKFPFGINLGRFPSAASVLSLQPGTQLTFAGKEYVRVPDTPLLEAT